MTSLSTHLLLQVHDWDQLPLILTNEHIAKLLHKSLRSIQDDASRAPWRLPPRLPIPGTRGVRYLRDEVRRWFEGSSGGTTPQPAPPPPSPGAPTGVRRRGRPRGTTGHAMRVARVLRTRGTIR